MQSVLTPCWFDLTQGVGGAPGGQRRQAGTEVMDMPEDTQIGFSGKGSGIFGSFATPARSARAPAQARPLTPLSG